MDEEEELENTLIGQEQEAPGVNTGDVMMGGLGLGTTGFAVQTGRAPAPRPMVPSGSELAQRVAANDAARLAAQNRPVLIGTGTSTSGVTNPRLIPETRLVPETRLATTTNPLATTPTGTPPSGQPRLTGPRQLSADDFDYEFNRRRRGFSLPKSVTNIASGLVKGGAVTGLLTPSEVARAEVYPPGTFFEDADGNVSLRPREGFFPINLADRPEGISFIKTDQEADTPAFTNTVAEIVAQKNARGPDATYTKEELDAISGFFKDINEDTAQREANIVNNQVELAKQINELGTVSDDQRAAQDFMDERAERAGETPTDVITPFQEQAELTADLFTDPDTEIGQFVPRATFTLPDGTIIQEDEGGNRREISAEQLRQFEQDMAGLGQPSVVGLGRGGDAGVIKSFNRPMGSEETQAALGGRTLNEYLNAPDRTTGVSGLRTDAQGRMITPAPQPAAPQTGAGVAEEVASGQPAGQPAAQTGPAKVPNEIMSQVVTTGRQTAEFRDANGDGVEDRQQGIFRPGELLGYDAQGNEVRAPGTQPPVNRGAGTPASPGATTNQLSPFELASLDRQLRMGGTGSFENDSALREAKLRGRPDFNEVRRDGDRTGGGLSQADARDLVQGSAKGATEGERMRALQIQSRLGLGEFKPEQTDLQEQYMRSRIAVMDAQLAESGIVPSAPPVVDPVTGVITQKYNDGTIRFKGVARNPNTGVIDPNFSGFLPDVEGDQSSKFKTGEIREQEIDGQTYRFQFDGENWNQI